MALSHEHIESKISEKIKIYILSRAKLLCSLCHEIPCIRKNLHIVDISSTSYKPHLVNVVNERPPEEQLIYKQARVRPLFPDFFTP